MSHDVILTLLALLYAIIFVKIQLKFKIFIFIFLVNRLNHLHISVLERFVMRNKRRRGRTILVY